MAGGRGPGPRAGLLVVGEQPLDGVPGFEAELGVGVVLAPGTAGRSSAERPASTRWNHSSSTHRRCLTIPPRVVADPTSRRRGVLLGDAAALAPGS